MAVWDPYLLGFACVDDADVANVCASDKTVKEEMAMDIKQELSVEGIKEEMSPDDEWKFENIKQDITTDGLVESKQEMAMDQDQAEKEIDIGVKDEGAAEFFKQEPVDIPSDSDDNDKGTTTMAESSACKYGAAWQRRERLRRTLGDSYVTHQTQAHAARKSDRSAAWPRVHRSSSLALADSCGARLARGCAGGQLDPG